MRPLTITSLAFGISVLITAFAYAQSPVISKLRIQDYYANYHGLQLREITYQLQAGKFIADSVLIHHATYYATTEHKRAEERKMKKEGTYRERKPIKGLSIVYADRNYPVDSVKFFYDTLSAAVVNTAVANIDNTKPRNLKSLDIDANDITIFLEGWRKRPGTQGRDLVDSVANMLTPEFEITSWSLDSCESMCWVASHGDSRYGLKVFVEYDNKDEKLLTQPDRCNVWPMRHLINLAPIIESIPGDIFHKRSQFGKSMVLYFSVSSLLAKLEKRKCYVMVRPGGIK